MIDPFRELGVPESADDATIRNRYLELIRTFTPEAHPERFARIRQAYELLRGLEQRVQYWLFHYGQEDSLPELIDEAIDAGLRRPVDLATLLRLTQP
jgi:curved DNA-binding protein CbpA